MRFVQNLLFVTAVLSMSAAGTALAGDDEPAEQELPEPVANLVDAMRDVQRVEPVGEGLFVIHRKMQLTGSRLIRDVEIQVTEHGEVLDWGRTPFMTRTYTQEQLRQTGRTDLADMLSRLDPSIQGNPGGR